LQATEWAQDLAAESDGKSKAANIPMIAITTSNSTSVNPVAWLPFSFILVLTAHKGMTHAADKKRRPVEAVGATGCWDRILVFDF
jgi:glucose-6-phosphate isomerase